MATGITKKEQHSKNSLTAFNEHDAPFILPKETDKVFLSYPNRVESFEVCSQINTDFYDVSCGNPECINENLNNCFMLADNFNALHYLIESNVKANLIYLDPPYGTGFNFQSRNLEHAYQDNMGVATYIEFMRQRIILMRECLSEEGSIYLHIGHQMLGHIKVIMDEIFGAGNFRNLITRRKCSSKNFTKKQYSNLNDYILFYSKGKSYTWSTPGTSPDSDWILREYPKIDSLGRRYKLVPIHAPGTRNGETGLPWRGMLPPPGKHWQYQPSKLDELDKQGDIHWSGNGNPRRKVYWTSDKKVNLTDYWSDFRDAHHQSIAITGYPTEKNLEMLKMIVGASSLPGDIVIDPFCGSGTTLQAAHELGRKFIGMDASFVAAKTTLQRMYSGTTPMGDYVNQHKKERNIQLLLQCAQQEKATCRFLVEKRIFEHSPEEVLSILKASLPANQM